MLILVKAQINDEDFDVWLPLALGFICNSVSTAPRSKEPTSTSMSKSQKKKHKKKLKKKEQILQQQLQQMQEVEKEKVGRP